VSFSSFAAVRSRAVWLLMVIAFAVTLPASAHIPAPQLVAQMGGVAPEIEPLALSLEPVKLYHGPTSFAILTPPDTQASRPIFGSSDGRAQQHLMHARFYNPQWGRFLSADPSMDLKKTIPNPQMWNRYAYASNNPVDRVDPDGKSWLIFNRKESTLTLYAQDGNVVGTWSASNKPDSKSPIDKLSGRYDFLDRKTAHKHGDAKVDLKDNGKAVLDDKGKQVQVLKDSPQGPYGANGIFRLKPFTDSQGDHAGLGVHDGKVGVRDGAGNTGWEAFTNGCVRTTPEAMEMIVKTAPNDPLDYLEAKDQ
jgi:RHS repeat-associated protein